MSPLIRPGISVLINDITDLDPNVNLLLGATLFYSAYPAAEGKAGIYAKWYVNVLLLSISHTDLAGGDSQRAQGWRRWRRASNQRHSPWDGTSIANLETGCGRLQTPLL